MAPERRALERLWEGDGRLARAARTALLPAELMFRAITTGRNALYDRGILRSHALALPAVSVGNLSVGGTGKTPVSADVARRLRARGARPGLVLRGYGGDEPQVHARLNPGVPVVVASDRVAGVERAAVLGADIAVLDDAFQHRRARRDADIVLISADQWPTGRPHLLPAGPWREPLAALARASLVVITRKAASDAQVDAVRSALQRTRPAVPHAVAMLRPSGLAAVGGSERLPMSALADRRVLALAAIGDPTAFVRQLTAAGARVVPAIFPDHHRFSRDDLAALDRDAAAVDLVVCTLKDAVKLELLWARARRPLWYVSQSVEYEQGEEAMTSLLDRLLLDRTHAS
ncbi:MAG TPA: tetraacyldisaccharide 4'-kinase [Gemmatimonadaceae bacterium]|nr:tetraacyldisaccharide 4'-kinase [Gemmatimonadaceae bacterium]